MLGRVSARGAQAVEFVALVVAELTLAIGEVEEITRH
jgi:hypothetical protein